MPTDGRFLELPDRDQMRVFAPSLRQVIVADRELLALDAALDELDLSALEADYVPVGRPAFPPRVLLKIHVYGYALGLRSSRSLDRACRYDDAFRFLASGLTPDFHTLCRFRRRHAAQFEELFVQIVRRCQAAGLVSLGHVAIDGSKLRANRSKQRLGHAVAEFRQALAQAEAEDRDLPEEDPEEARFMKTTEGIAPAYNAQIAVDADHQVIVAQQVRTEAVDQGLLGELVAQVEANCGQPPGQVSADGGYLTEADVARLDAGPSELYLPPKVAGGAEAGQYEWLPEQRAYRCPAGKLLRPYRVRRGCQIYRIAECAGCVHARHCRVQGRSKEVHVPLPETARGRLAQRMASAAGRAVYARRKAIVEPVFGRFKHNWGVRRLLVRGRSGAQAEGTLLCLAHNLGKLTQARAGGGPEGSGGGQRSCLVRVLRWHNQLTGFWGGAGLARA